MSVHDIKTRTALEVGEPSIGYARTLRTYSGYDVAGSEAKENFASSAGFVLCRKRCGGRMRMTNVPYFKMPEYLAAFHVKISCEKMLEETVGLAIGFTNQ